MPGDGKGKNGLTLASLYQLIQERDRQYQEKFAAQEKAVSIAMSMSDKAGAKAAEAIEKRFEATNEWRETVTDLMSRYLTRTEWDTKQTDVVQHIDRMDKQLAVIAGESRQKETSGNQVMWGIGLIVSLAASIVALVIEFMRPR